MNTMWVKRLLGWREDATYWLMMKLIKRWVDYHMDEFDQFTLVDYHGNLVNVKFSYQEDTPETYNAIDIGGYLE